LNIKDIIKMYNELWILLKNNKDVVYYLDDKYNYNENDNDKLKIMFRNIVRGKNNNNNDNNMVNNWTEYKNTNNNNRFIREVIIYKNNIENPLIKWIDFICLDDNLDVFNVNTDSIKENINKLFYFNNFRIVERHINEIKFTWDDYKLINRNKNFKNINTSKEWLNFIQPLESIIIFQNFVQNFKVPTLEELPHEQGFDNKIGVIDLETYTIDIDKNNYYKQSVYAGGLRVGDISTKYYIGDEGCENSVSLIKKMFDYIFKDGFSNYTFYAHNTGKFDSHFIVNSLLIKDNEYENYDVKLIVGDSNDIIELAIKRKKEKGSVLYKDKNNYGTIRIHDSYKFIP